MQKLLLVVVHLTLQNQLVDVCLLGLRMRRTYFYSVVAPLLYESVLFKIRQVFDE